MIEPPARIPQQPWTYPPTYPPSGHDPSPLVGGYYLRGNQPGVPQSRITAEPIWHGERSSGNGKQIAALILAGIGILIVVFFTMLEAGFSGTVVGAIAALVPLALVLGAVRWLDRWEPEPRLYLLLSFGWGAGVATTTALLLNTKAFSILSKNIADPAAVELLGVGLVAPITEEVLKGGALLAIVLLRSRLINSATDLVVYAATIASGFAFTENILYFARGTSEGIFGAVFFGRAVMSPFAHLMFTSAIALVLASVLFARRSSLWWAYPLGTLLAIGLHSAWNVSAALAGASFFTVFMWLHVPIFGMFVLIVVLLRRRERRNIVENLERYCQAGWFAPHEVRMLGSLSQRSRAQSWARRYGVRAGAVMAQFQLAATKLALNRQQMIHAARRNATNLADLRSTEEARLEEIQNLRKQFLHLAGPVGHRFAPGK